MKKVYPEDEYTCANTYNIEKEITIIKINQWLLLFFVMLRTPVYLINDMLKRVNSKSRNELVHDFFTNYPENTCEKAADDVVNHLLDFEEKALDISFKYGAILFFSTSLIFIFFWSSSRTRFLNITDRMLFDYKNNAFIDTGLINIQGEETFKLIQKQHDVICFMTFNNKLCPTTACIFYV